MKCPEHGVDLVEEVLFRNIKVLTCPVIGCFFSVKVDHFEPLKFKIE